MMSGKVADGPGAEYLSSRNLLLRREEELRHDYEFKSRMSPVARHAARVVAAIRSEERDTVWKDTSITPRADPLYPGMPFFLARDHIDKSRLWSIVSKMPKGSLLHAHMEAMVDIGWLIDQILAIPGYYIFSEGPLDSPEARLTGKFRFKYAPQLDHDLPTSDLWKSSYAPNDAIPIKRAANLFPGGSVEFRSWMITRITVNREESLCNFRGVDNIWKKFSNSYMTISTLFFTEPIFRGCIPRILHQLHQDGIRYVELRMCFVTPFHRAGASTADPDFLYFLECFKQEVDSYMSTEKGAQFWGARIIWTSIRRLSSETIQNDMAQCVKGKLAYPSVISGFDFVGQEDPGAPLVELEPLCVWFKEQCVANNIDIPFFFHAGECLGDGDKTDRNLVDAILLGARRIGHGFSLYKHPLLIDLVKEKSIMIESCPISHEVLRLISSTSAHSMSALHSRNVPMSLNNDDPALMGHGQVGLTPDFFQVIQGLEAVGLEGLAVMAENSVRWSVFKDEGREDWIAGIKNSANGDGIKARRIREWQLLFESWCQWIVDTYGKENE